MVRLVCALLLVAVATCSASQSRIVGGESTTVEQYPSVVQIQARLVPGVWTQVCGGTILTRLHVLSACTCFTLPRVSTRRRRIIAGSSYRNTGGIRSNVVRIACHPSFNEDRGYDGNIAVVQLEYPLAFSNIIQQGTIIGQGVAVPDNMRVVQVGYGVTLEEVPDIRADQLQAVSVYTVNNAVCAANYAGLLIPREVTSNMICAGHPEGGVGACVGDTGGPLYFSNIVVGVISFGFGCTNATFPRVHTAVSPYTNWIVQTAV